MKIAIIYFSKTGRTRAMAEVVADGAGSVSGVEVRLFELDRIDKSYLAECKAVFFGTPTYLASTCWELKKWFDEIDDVSAGRANSAPCSPPPISRRAAPTSQSRACSGTCWSRGCWSIPGGGAWGLPYIHLGAVALKENFEASKPMFRTFGERGRPKGERAFRTGEVIAWTQIFRMIAEELVRRREHDFFRAGTPARSRAAE